MFPKISCIPGARRSFSLPVCMLLLCLALVLPHRSAAGAEGLAFLPSGNLYPVSPADPQSVGFGLQVQHYTDTSIPDSGRSRVALKSGGQFGIVRAGSEGEAWQLDLLGGLNAQFDADHSLDNIGWDGRYGLLVTTSRPALFAFKLGALHDSSHVGDEYIERTGRRRIGYTRHELVAGISLPVNERLRIYSEAAHGYQLGNRELMKPGRVQAGMEYGYCRGDRDRCYGWIGAADLSAMEERDWRIDAAVFLGMQIRSGGRTWRFGIDGYRGRPPIGEFFQHTEQHVGISILLDV